MKQRIVIKVGTSTLLGAHEQPKTTFEMVAKSIEALSKTYDVVLVTSGAIGFGVRQLNLPDRPQDVASLQALASLGQVGLMERWNQAVSERAVGQVLVTARELNEPDSVKSLTETFHAMWKFGIIPIINENDAVTSDEITFGDNDKLAALVAVNIQAHVFVLLTDQDGIQKNFGTQQQERITEISLRDAHQYATERLSEHSRGGMKSKLSAANIALSHGVATYIGYAASPEAIESILASKSGTKLVQ